MSSSANIRTTRSISGNRNLDNLIHGFQKEREIQLSAFTDSFGISEECKRYLLDPELPKILLAGLPRSGKTSLIKVVYERISPHELSFVQPSTNFVIEPISTSRITSFVLIDMPGGILAPQSSFKGENEYYDSQSLNDISPLFAFVDSLVFVIDGQNEPFTQEMQACKAVMRLACQMKRNVNLEVFIHKVDGDLFILDDVRDECQRMVHNNLMAAFNDEGIDSHVSFFATSIYDHTCLEAFSRVAMKVFPRSAVIEELLDLVMTNCRMEKLFLIDVFSKTYIATDSSPFDPFYFELCTDMIEVAFEVSAIYSKSDDGKSQGHVGLKKGQPAIRSDSTQSLLKTCLIQLNTGHILYLKEVGRQMALACVIREENLDRQYMLDHNIQVLRGALDKLYSATKNLYPDLYLMDSFHEDLMRSSDKQSLFY